MTSTRRTVLARGAPALPTVFSPRGGARVGRDERSQASRYVQILQRTPFPDCWEQLPEWQIQVAEYDLRINAVHYYEWAIKMGGCFYYPLEIAECIVSYWETRWQFARYELKEMEE